MDIHPKETTVESASQTGVTAAEQNDSSSSPQIDNANRNSSFYSTHNEGQNGETTFIPASPPYSSTLFSEVSTEQTHGNQVSVEELSENRAQLAHLPSNRTDPPQLPSSVPVRRPSQSQPNDRAQSAATSPPVAQNPSTRVPHAPTPASSAAPQGHQLPSQHSHESYRVPNAQTPQTHSSRTSGNNPAASLRSSGESWGSGPSLSTPSSRQYTTPLSQSAPTTPSVHSGMSSQPYGPGQSVVTPQQYSWGPTQPPIPQLAPPQSYIASQANQSIYEGTHQQFAAPPQSYRLPGASTPRDQPTYAGVSQQFVPQPAPPQSYRVPGASTPRDQSSYAGVSQQFIPQSAPPQLYCLPGASTPPFGHVPSRKPYSASLRSHRTASSRYNSNAQATGQQTSRKANVFVASDPFRVSHRNEKVDSPSDGLTFDDIPTAGPSARSTRNRRFRSQSLPIVQPRYAGTPQQFTPHSLPNTFTPRTQSIHVGTPQQFTPHSLPNTLTPRTQSIHVGTPQQFPPHSLPPNVPTPQAQSIHAGTPQQFTPHSLPPNVPTPQAQSIHAGTPQQFTPHSLPPNMPTPRAQSTHVGTPQQFLPQPVVPPPFYSTSNVPRPQASQSVHTGTPQASQMSNSYIPPTPSYPTGNNSSSQATRQRTESFVANNPFQMSYGHDMVDVPSNFDDISTARSSPERQGMMTSPYGASYGALPSQPTYGGYYPGATPPAGVYGQNQISTPWGVHSTFNGSQSWYQPEIRRSRSRSSSFAYPSGPLPGVPVTQTPMTPSSWLPVQTPSTPYIPPLPDDDASSIHRQPEDTGFAEPESLQPWYQPDSPQPWYQPMSHSRSRHSFVPAVPETQPPIMQSPWFQRPTEFTPPVSLHRQPGDTGLAQAYSPQSWYRPAIHQPTSRTRVARFAPDALATQTPNVQSSWLPVRPSTPFPEDDVPLPEGTSLAQPNLPLTPDIQPETPISVTSPPIQSQAPVPVNEEGQQNEEEVSSTASSIHPPPQAVIPPVIANMSPVAPPGIPVDRPPSPRSQYMPFYQHEPHMGASQSPPFGPAFDPLYPYYPPFPPDLQHPPYLQYPPYLQDQPYLQHPPYLQHLPYLQPPPYQYPKRLKKTKKSIFSRFFRRSNRTQSPANPRPFTAIYPQPFTEPFTTIYPPMDPENDWHEAAVTFLLAALPKQMYLLLLLRLPSLYFSRVSRIFEEADMSLPEIKKMALETASQGLTHEFEIQMAFESPTVPPAYKRLTSTWESFIDSVMREWKTFNIISVLLLSAILSILQIAGAADDPLTRYTALFSLMCALISLLFGCMYIIRFGSMRKSYKAAEWALEVKKTRLLIYWNVWVLLAMPAIWLTWSIILYIACIMSFIWRSGVADTTPPPGLSDTGVLIIRVVMSAVLGIGLLYGVLIMTTFQRYGTVMDKAWKQRIDDWIKEKSTGNKDSFPQPALDDPMYSPSYSSDTLYEQPAYGSSLRHLPSFDDINGRYPHGYGPDPYAPAPDIPSPRGSVLSNAPMSYQPGPNQSSVNAFPNHSSDFQGRGSIPPATYDSRGTPHPWGLVGTAEEFPRSLYPILESPIVPNEVPDNGLGFSSGLENRSGGGEDAHRNRVRFRLPSATSDSSM